MKDLATNNIMFVLPSLKMGGAERVMINILNNVQAQEKRLVIFDPDMDMKNFVNEDIKIHILGSSRVLFGLPKFIRTVWKLKPDVIVSTLTHMNFALLLAKPFLPSRTKIIVRETTPASVITSKKKSGLLAYILYNILYAKAHAVILPSEKIKNELCTIIRKKNVKYHILPNPVDIEKIRFHALENIKDVHVNNNNLNLLCVGRLHKAKGFDLLLENLNTIPATISWNLTIVGDGAEREDLERLIDLHKLADRVALKGMSTNPWAYMARADLLLLPSRWEGLPNVALESLAVGTPVLAMATAGGIQEIANNANGSITVVQTMAEFIQRIAKTQKLNSDRRESLLPEAYTRQSVVPAFQNIVKSL